MITCSANSTSFPHLSTHKRLSSARKTSRVQFRTLFFAFLICLISCSVFSAPKQQVPEPMLGANAFDLLLQFNGRGSGGDGSLPWLNLTRAMGQKSTLDARDAGFSFLRVAAAGYGPSWPDDPQHDDLALWRSDPHAYWTRVDALFDTVDQANLRLIPSFIWNAAQFPALAHETVRDLITNPQSGSMLLAQRYITEFVMRYRNRPTVLFYEMGNELNLLADLDSNRRCRREYAAQPFRCISTGNFSTDDLTMFSKRIVNLLHELDPSRRISSGFGNLRPAAAHLAKRPEWSQEGPDWTQDSLAEFTSFIRLQNASFDIASLHLYPGSDTVRPTLGTRSPSDYTQLVARLMHPLGKKVFVGEFADPNNTGLSGSIATLLQTGVIDGAALWAWEFYQFSPTHSLDAEAGRYDVEPGNDEAALLPLKPVLASPVSPPLPRIVLTSPVPCMKMDKPITLQAIASVGNALPAQVEFFLDDTLLGVATTFPYRLIFDPRRLTGTSANIGARAIAVDGKKAEFVSPINSKGAAPGCAR